MTPAHWKRILDAATFNQHTVRIVGEIADNHVMSFHLWSRVAELQSASRLVSQNSIPEIDCRRHSEPVTSVAKDSGAAVPVLMPCPREDGAP
jgi:hypothetical protein